MGDSFQVHVFSDTWMEMMLESDGWMCYNHVVFEGFHFFDLFTNLVSRGVVWGVILMTFGDFGDTFYDC